MAHRCPILYRSLTILIVHSHMRIGVSVRSSIHLAHTTMYRSHILLLHCADDIELVLLLGMLR